MVRRLVQQLSESDVIVYVDDGRCRVGFASCISVRAAANGQRYIRITVRQSEPRDVLLSHIGHELQHACEIAAAPAAKDDESIKVLYRQIGREMSGEPGVFETAEARRVGQVVAAELAASRGLQVAASK
jgi:hypothetical protein